jgi:prepilin-type N-terminal cleavage/methylation domain-containing protein
MDKNAKRYGINDEYGFTLVEVMMAIVILGVALLAFAGVSFYSITQASGADMLTSATTLAMDQAENIKSLPYEDVTSGEDPNNPVDSTGQPDGHFTREWVVEDDVPDAGTKTVTITVSYNDQGRTEEVRIMTIVAEPAGSEVES